MHSFQSSSRRLNLSFKAIIRQYELAIEVCLKSFNFSNPEIFQNKFCKFVINIRNTRITVKQIRNILQIFHIIFNYKMSELTPDTAYPEVAKERRSSSFSEAHLEKVF